MSGPARIPCAGWMLKVWRRGPTAGGDGWPGYPAVTTVEFGGDNESDSGRPLLEIVGDDAVRDLIAKLQEAVTSEAFLDVKAHNDALRAQVEDLKAQVQVQDTVEFQLRGRVAELERRAKESAKLQEAVK